VCCDEDGGPGVRLANAVVFDGTRARLLGTAAAAAALAKSTYVALFSGVQVCDVADTWRGSRLLAPASAGLLTRTTGLFGTDTLTPMHAMPLVELCDDQQSKAIYGIVVEAFVRGDRTTYVDGGVLRVRGTDTSAPARVALVTSGEAGCWVLDTNGDVHNGDLLQSAQAGFAERQTGDDVTVSTLGKSTTAAADWDGAQHPDTPAGARSAFIGVVVHCG
jgi:hypothetical protein